MKLTTLIAGGLTTIGAMLSQQVEAQGCVAIRSFAMCNPNAFSNGNLHGRGWMLSTNYRYFESYKHFSGTEENESRQELHTSVFNWVNQVNLGLTYNFNKREGLTIVLPYSYNTRSSLYEHGNKARYQSRSSGIGDMRVTYNRWMWHPDSVSRGNLQLGVGLKLPTGDYNAMDFFYNEGTDTVPNSASNPWGQYQPVDQSIQLGDGGLGVTVEMQAYIKLVGPLYGYMNAFYLLNPMEVNGTLTYRGRANERIMSVADQYMVRAGLSGNLSKKAGISILCGGRLEGIPVEDLVGGSLGFRRPGYVISVEPGIDWMHGRHDVNLSMGLAMVRDRTQSVTDIENTALSTNGQVVHGDAAFADNVFNISWSVRLGDGH
ncbi:MAG: hypothetical protein ABI599_12500 [Flavobacteriales bacterium]